MGSSPATHTCQQFLAGCQSTKKLFPSTHTIWNYISYLSIFLTVYQYLLRHCYHSFLFLQTQLQVEQTTIQSMIELFYSIKNNAYFHIGFKRLFLQKQSFATGPYESADIANLALFIFEIHLFSFSMVSD